MMKKLFLFVICIGFVVALLFIFWPVSKNLTYAQTSNGQTKEIDKLLHIENITVSSDYKKCAFNIDSHKSLIVIQDTHPSAILVDTQKRKITTFTTSTLSNLVKENLHVDTVTLNPGQTCNSLSYQVSTNSSYTVRFNGSSPLTFSNNQLTVGSPVLSENTEKLTPFSSPLLLNRTSYAAVPFVVSSDHAHADIFSLPDIQIVLTHENTLALIQQELNKIWNKKEQLQYVGLDERGKIQYLYGAMDVFVTISPLHDSLCLTISK